MVRSFKHIEFRTQQVRSRFVEKVESCIKTVKSQCYHLISKCFKDTVSFEQYFTNDTILSILLYIIFNECQVITKILI